MNFADKEYTSLVAKIKDNGTWNTNEKIRAIYADGKPAYAKSIFGVQVEFRGNKIPLLTAKKVFSVTALKEMLLFWVNQTVKEEDFKEANVKVWDEWFVDGSLGRSYAYQFESRPSKEIVEVEPRIKEHHGELPPIVIDSIKNPNVESNHSEVGKTYNHPLYGDFTILDVFRDDTAGYQVLKAVIQFVITGYSYIVVLASALKGKVRDPYSRQTCGVGCLGNYQSVRNLSEKQIKRLLRVWQNMLSRCYNAEASDYVHYGEKGVFVHPDWHIFENFLRDIRRVPQWFLAKDELESWQLDKDYYSSNCYSKETCVWLHQKDNALYRKASRPVYVIDSEENKHLYLSIKEASVDLNFDAGDGSRVLNGKQKTVSGYQIIPADDNIYPYRYEVSRNQVVDLIEGIKNNPSSRRHMTSFWNDKDVKKKALQECAWATTWNVRDDILDLILIQRSGDIGLGIPFNWIQYWMLLNMIAHVSDLQVGDFIHQIGNLHYYDRHEETLLQQLSLPTFETPEIWINPDVKDFFDFTPEDVKILNYKSGPFLKMEVAI